MSVAQDTLLLSALHASVVDCVTKCLSLLSHNPVELSRFLVGCLQSPPSVSLVVAVLSHGGGNSDLLGCILRTPDAAPVVDEVVALVTRLSAAEVVAASVVDDATAVGSPALPGAVTGSLSSLQRLLRLLLDRLHSEVAGQNAGVDAVGGRGDDGASTDAGGSGGESGNNGQDGLPRRARVIVSRVVDAGKLALDAAVTALSAGGGNDVVLACVAKALRKGVVGTLLPQLVRRD